MSLSPEDYWHFFNISSYSLQPPMNPTSYESAKQFLKTLTQRHGHTFDILNNTSKPGNLSDTAIITARITKQSAVIMWEYQRALEQEYHQLAEQLEKRYVEILHSPMNLALVEFIAASSSSNDLIQFIIDLNKMTKEFSTQNMGVLFGEITPERQDLLAQGYSFYLYFFGVFPGKEE